MTTYIPTSEIFRETLKKEINAGLSEAEVIAQIRSLRQEARQIVSRAREPGFVAPIPGYIPAYGMDVTIAAKLAYCRLRRLARTNQHFAGWFANLVASDWHDPELDALLGPDICDAYLEQPGESYMGPRQREYFRGVLSAWRTALLAQIERRNAHLRIKRRLCGSPRDLSGHEMSGMERTQEGHSTDATQVSYSGERERRLIAKVEAALERISDGSFGFCADTGRPIGFARLVQRPIATTCTSSE